MTSPSPSQPFGYGQPTGSSLIPFFNAAGMGGGGQQQPQQQGGTNFGGRPLTAGNYIGDIFNPDSAAATGLDRFGMQTGSVNRLALGGHVTPTSQSQSSFPMNAVTSPRSSAPQMPQQQQRIASAPPPGTQPNATPPRPDMNRFNDQASAALWRSNVSSVGGGAFGLNTVSTTMAGNLRFTQNNGLQQPHHNSLFSNSTPTLDLSEFPSLTNRADQSSSGNNPMAGRAPYVGMVKQPHQESNEFHIQNEDFPALPGSQGQDSGSSSKNNNNSAASNASQQQQQGPLVDSNALSNADKGPNYAQLNGSGPQSPPRGDRMGPHNQLTGSSQQQQQLQQRSPGIVTTKDGMVSNIPSSMVKDQFGMVGLLTLIRLSEQEPQLVSLAMGSDLTSLGLNLNAQDNLYQTFGGPWSDMPCRPQDMGEYMLPPEYLINVHVRDKLAPIKLSRYGDDLLFFIFYMFGGDIMQVIAAAELYNREWRFHRDERVWITRAGFTPTEKTNTYERGTYYVFDPINWRKLAKEFHLEYDRLEEKPPVLHFPQNL